MDNAFDIFEIFISRSMILQDTPRRASMMAAMRPTGPAPLMRTEVCEEDEGLEAAVVMMVSDFCAMVFLTQCFDGLLRWVYGQKEER